MLSADPEDYSSAVHYNVTFRQSGIVDSTVPANTALSTPILISIIDDGISEGEEYFQVRIVGTSDGCRVRIGLDTVSITITDSESFHMETIYMCVRSSPEVSIEVVLYNNYGCDCFYLHFLIR